MDQSSTQFSEHLKERMARLSPARRDQLDRRMRGEVVEAQARGPVLRRRNGADYPLSPEQEHLWLVHQLGGETHYLNLSHGYLLEGPLDIGCLERALNEIVRRHENLRTAFPEVNGRPQPVISPDLLLSLPANICRPFDLFHGPLIRATIYKLGEREHALLVTMHHIVGDRVSFDVLNKELAVLYHAYSQGAPSPLPVLPIQYGDFAIWLSEWMKSGEAARQVDYWRKTFPELPRLNLPADLPRTQSKTFRAGRLTWQLEEPFWQALNAIALSEKVTRFVVFLALYALFLRAHTETDEIVIAVPVSNRKHVETHDLIGYFLNTVLFRVSLAGSPSFRRLLQQTRDFSLEVLANSDLPFEYVLHELALEASGAVAVETVYAYTNDFAEPASRNVGLTIRPLNPVKSSRIQERE